MLWLGLQVNTIKMTITIPDPKLAEICSIVASLARNEEANIHDLHTPLGNIFSVAPCCLPSKFFINHMLNTPRECLAVGAVILIFSEEFQKELNWFTDYLPTPMGIHDSPG